MASFTKRMSGGIRGHAKKEREDIQRRAVQTKIRMDRKADKKATKNMIRAIQKAETNGTITPQDAALARLTVNSLSLRLHKKSLFTSAQIKAQLAITQDGNLTHAQVREGIKTWTDFFLNPPVD